MDSKVIIYGAGYRGTAFYEFIEKNGMGDIVYAFCDQNYDKIKEVDGKKVVSFQEACSYNLPFFISIIDEGAVKEVKKMITDAGREVLEFSSLAKEFGEDIVTLNRDFCAFFHIKGMDSYFDEAEEKACLDVFWKDGSPFYEKFKELNLGNVIELACGRGRHVPFYVDKSKKVTLVDILQENIDICKKRFQKKSNIEYYCNNGYNLSELETGKYTALFCYDAMVHFEMMDIYEYLKDIYRVLVPGGMVLIHHSNYTADYKASFANTPHGRSFMSKDIFAYLAYRCGFEIISQQVINWGVKDLDCISLIHKPE